jgi:hypothetical protein
MKRLLAVTLGILTAIGGFVDIGDIVAGSEVGARFGTALFWVLPVGVIGICVYAEMCGRVAAQAGRPVFDLVRERLGLRVALVNLGGSYLVTMLTLAAEIGGVALAVQLLSGIDYLLWVPAVGVALWLGLWRLRFETLERVFGLTGLALMVMLIALFAGDPPWSSMATQALHPVPAKGENWNTYWYFAIALFASAMTPYEVFFFSSGGVEERWTGKDLMVARINAFVGFPLGGLLAFGFMERPPWPSIPPASPSARWVRPSFPPDWSSARSGWPARSSASSPRPSGRPSRPACRPDTPLRSTSAGAGASMCLRGAPRAFIRWSC